MDRKGLGRGLAALIPGGEETSAVTEVEIDAVSLNPYQPRKNLAEESVAELAASIKTHGVIQPIVIRTTASGGYELVAGERRLRAAKRAGLRTIPALLRNVADQQSLEIALVENLQREDINPLDAARAYRRLIDEFDLSQEEIAERVGKSRPAVANTLRLLQLPDSIQSRLEDGQLSEGHCRALLAIENLAGQLVVADEIARKQCSVREAERLARQWSRPRKRNVSRETISDPGADANLLAVEEHLRQLFSTHVRVTRGVDRGHITIEFYGEDDLNRILEIVGGYYKPVFPVPG